MKKYVWLVLIILFVLNLIDGIFTYISVSSGIAIEINPIMNWCLNKGIYIFFLVKAVLISGCILVLYLHKEKLVSIIGSYFLCFIYFLIVCWHLLNIF